jgi:hypothetical protein
MANYLDIGGVRFVFEEATLSTSLYDKAVHLDEKELGLY